MLKNLGIRLILGGSSLPVLTFANVISKAEGNSGTTSFTFTLNLIRNGYAGEIPFAWSVSGVGLNPANADDFVGGILPSGSGLFATSENSKQIIVDVAGDTAVEPNENFLLTLLPKLVFKASALGTILDDDTPPPQTIGLQEGDSLVWNWHETPSAVNVTGGTGPFTLTNTPPTTTQTVSGRNITFGAAR